MSVLRRPRRRRFLAPEIVQTSAMDCGPAALKCLLEGFGIPVSYGRLREACQTDVDGTSIDTLEEVAGQLGLEAEQTMMPADHVFLDETRALPALVVVRLPEGMTHFVVAWRRHGKYVQVMDPAVGRRWLPRERFLDELYAHTATVSAADWRAWAASEEWREATRRRLLVLGLPGRHAEQYLERAASDKGWETAARLDAGVRLTDALVRAGGIAFGTQAERFLNAATEDRKMAGGRETIPDAFWSVRPAGRSESGADQVFLRGAVLLRVFGPRASAGEGPARATVGERPLSAELAAAMTEAPARPGRELLKMVRRDGLLVPAVLIGAIVLASAGVTLEALLLRGLLDLGKELTPPRQRLIALGAVAGLVAVITLLEWRVAEDVLRMGRRLEARLRIAFLEKLPRLADRYFHSRPISDMAERSHSIHELRAIPHFGASLLRAFFELVFTALGLIWLDPGGATVTLLAASAGAVFPLVFQPLMTERDLRLRTHLGSLGRFYLDGLMGLIPIRAHAAERSVRREQERVLVEWSRAGLSLQRLAAAVEAVQAVIGLVLAAVLLLGYLARHEDLGGVLLVAYWALGLPLLGQRVGTLAWQYPSMRNIALRMLEPLGAPEDVDAPVTAAGAPQGDPASHASGVSVRFDHVTVSAAGHVILNDVSVTVEAGSHVAIVGASGAGKSSLVGMLLGWHRPVEGGVTADGRPLDAAHLSSLRRATAWVDPTVQLWNRSLFENLSYGQPPGEPVAVSPAIEAADLRGLLESLPEGMQTRLGEGGALVSGGEGQRVRFGRAILRRGIRLAILDEPFRGLDRARRRELLARARAWWKEATLLCITHDVRETREFERVVVMDAGRIVEDGRPEELAARTGSRYRALLDAERDLDTGLWSSAAWRRWRLEQGRLQVTNGEASP